MTLARLRPLPSSATSTGPTALTVEAFADAAGIDAEVVRRFVALGLLDPMPGVRGELRFPPAQLAVAARIRRLRAGLGLNYAALGLVMDLLDRIARLELALRNVGASGGWCNVTVDGVARGATPDRFRCCAIEPGDKSRFGVPLLQTAGHDTHHARVPAIAADQQEGIVALA